jgi:hypothetical protein
MNKKKEHEEHRCSNVCFALTHSEMDVLLKARGDRNQSQWIREILFDYIKTQQGKNEGKTDF